MNSRASSHQSAACPKKVYSTPSLTVYGPIEKITQQTVTNPTQGDNLGKANHKTGG
jgi:hypothetical protein